MADWLQLREVSSYTRHLERNAINPAARSDVKGLAIPSAPIHIRRSLRSQDHTQRLTLRRKDPYPSRPRAVHISFPIDLHPIRPSRPLVGGRIIEDLCIRQRAILLHA